MKIALCFSGQPRFVKQTYQNYLDNLILPNNIEDIFVHCWWDETKIHEPVITSWESVGAHLNLYVEGDAINFIKEKYNPKLLVYEKDDFSKYINEGEFGKKEITQPVIFQSMCNSIYKCNEFRKQYEQENNLKYDLIIRTRFDLNILEKVDLNNVDDKYLYIPACNFKAHCVINDQFAFGDSDTMDIYSNIFKHERICGKKMYI
jgi:hypothetical protein